MTKIPSKKRKPSIFPRSPLKPQKPAPAPSGSNWKSQTRSVLLLPGPRRSEPEGGVVKLTFLGHLTL